MWNVKHSTDVGPPYLTAHVPTYTTHVPGSDNRIEKCAVLNTPTHHPWFFATTLTSSHNRMVTIVHSKHDVLLFFFLQLFFSPPPEGVCVWPFGFPFQSFLGFGQSADIDIYLDGQETRKTADVKVEDGKKEKLLLYYDGETVSGKVGSSGGVLQGWMCVLFVFRWMWVWRKLVVNWSIRALRLSLLDRLSCFMIGAIIMSSLVLLRNWPDRGRWSRILVTLLNLVV